ncbi:TIGR03936 family radical SAM-associated protein [Pseudonocardia sp. NPDC049635]|uniref:TIGR03936 family radical SAM-associated protein n=1 Tax=Pseudonocardia sp. NPDC049635 TaxID=3155506 RepID=UPI0034023977
MARVKAGAAANPAPPTVQRVRLRFAKRGRLRFLSHRDIARSFERAVRRAGVPVSHSHGFSPHPRLSWVGAAPTGAASEAEYVEMGLTREVDPELLREALDRALPEGLDVLAAAVAEPPALADRIDAARWRLEVRGVSHAEVVRAVTAFLEQDSVIVTRVTPSGRKEVDVRAALVSLAVEPQVSGDVADHAPADPAASPDPTAGCAILTAVVRQTTPTVRPDDVLGALNVVADLTPPVPVTATRMAQGLLDDGGDLVDPLGSAPVTRGRPGTS